MNKILVVKEIEYEGLADLQKVSQLLDEQVETHSIEKINWKNFPYKPQVHFKMAHNNNQIWLKYIVEEETVLAEKTRTNQLVSMDSCVEFFFDPLGDGNYYNFEFNCIGTTLLAYGPQRKEREYITPKTIEHLVKVGSSLGKNSFVEKKGGHKWEVTIVLPVEILAHDPGIKLKGLKSRANFYKCGDATSTPHYLSWNPIDTKKPDFHRPEFFGELIFE
ncbi:carbohydrate-binding family 9-like protein [Maribacter sp. 2304DJ31-5]|uniref:carbohydrate-binding family 9-like protein n=1 Tax=Maribacter sp. 2304DJ31-5 TaxID=3386273 RepID=UPI0039BC4BD2